MRGFLRMVCQWRMIRCPRRRRQHSSRFQEEVEGWLFSVWATAATRYLSTVASLCISTVLSSSDRTGGFDGLDETSQPRDSYSCDHRRPELGPCWFDQPRSGGDYLRRR